MTPEQIEAAARAACEADNIDPDKFVAGKRAWKHYVKAIKSQPAVPELTKLPEGAAEVFAAVKSQRMAYKELETEARKIDALLRKLIKSGTVIKVGDEYWKIEHLSYWIGFGVQGRCRKLNADGQWSRQTREIHLIEPEMFAS